MKTNWPADKVERRKVASLIPYARNARTHSPEQVDQIAASIREWGWTIPILIDENGGLIAGHGRIMAARKLGIAEVPCMTAVGWSEAQKKAYIIADNKLAMNAGWDNDLLKIELGDLGALNFDLSLTGFGLDEIATLLVDRTEGLTDPDEVPEPPAEPVSVLGDVWVLGKHRIVCGDATNPTDWERLKIGHGFILFTSPPYNLGEGAKLSGNKNISKNGNAYGDYKDEIKESDYTVLLNDVLSTSMTFVDLSVINVQPLANSKRPIIEWMGKWSSNLIDIVTWDKGHAAPPMAKGVMASRYEWIFLFSNKEKASRSIPYSSWQGKFSNVYNAPPQRNNEFASVHGATFPVHLPEYIVGDLVNRCRGVVDCFLGTGTTIIAAEKLGREGRGIELSPTYVDVSVTRWQKFTGQQATLEATGQTFSEVKESGRAAAN
jgi:DNA modification methylase